MMPLPLSSAYITRAENPNIMLGKSPERDREIDDICQMIRNAARAGIPALEYNMSILGVVRTEPTPGRGGARYSTFVYDKAKQEPPLTEAGPVQRGRVLGAHHLFPGAGRSGGRGIQGAAGLPSARSRACRTTRAIRGVHTVLGSVDGLKRFVSIKESPYHGLNFCQGTVSEMLQNPGEEIFDVIRYFGRRKKIFNVHFRNIRGGFLELPGDLHRRRRRGHAEGDAGVQGGRLRRHDDARPCAGDSGDAEARRRLRSPSATSRRSLPRSRRNRRRSLDTGRQTARRVARGGDRPCRSPLVEERQLARWIDLIWLLPFVPTSSGLCAVPTDT